MKRILSLIILSLSVMLAFSACQKEKVLIPSTGVTLNPSSITMLVGEWKEISASVTPGDVTCTFNTWKSSNTGVAVVDNWGRVSGMSPGKATITASNGDFSATCEVTVNPVVETAITLNPASLTVKEDAQATITATISPKNATYTDIEWTSSNETVAKVDKETGVVTGVAMGNATITAKSHHGVTATCAVTVVVNVPTEPETLDIWKSDAPGYRAILGGSSDVTSDFLTYSAAGGVVTWGENTTGKPRTATLVTGSSSITVTQVEAKDFKGTYSFRAQRFSNNTKVTTAAADVTFDVTIGDPLVGETLENFDGKTYTNNLGLTGLYLDAVADAVVEIDYPAKSARFGLFLDERKAQAVDNGNATYPYVCFIPECGTVWSATAMTSPWNFVPKPISATQNYQWLWFTVDSACKVLNYDYPNKQFLIGTDGSNGTTIIGITCAVAKNATPTADDIFGTYNVIYQANPGKKMDTGGFTLTRK